MPTASPSPPPTHEPEITDPVRLCDPAGRLSAAAVGWSRKPLHTANLRGWGRNKRWDYWAILAGDLVVSATYADVDYLGIADVWWADLVTGEAGGRNVPVPLALGMALPDRPGTEPLRFRGRRLRMEITDEPRGDTHLLVEWLERDGTPARLRASVGLPAGHESLNVVIPFDAAAQGDRRFQYTSKHQARPAVGTLQVGGRRRAFGGSDAEAWGVLDVGRGRWPYRTDWNWGGGAGVAADGRTVVGLQLGGRWTVGTGLTENGVIVDGRLTKVGAELDWSYDWDDPLSPWRVTAPDDSLRLVLAPRHDKHSRTELGVMGMEVHQVFGTWSGRVRAEDGALLELEGLQGFAEESRSRW